MYDDYLIMYDDSVMITICLNDGLTVGIFDILIFLIVFNLRHVIYIPSFYIVNLLCCGDHFSKMTSVDA